MINAAPDTTRHLAAAATDVEQLTLLPNDSVTPRFRLSRDTRERGLRHVAEIRRMLAERAPQPAVAPIAASQGERVGHGARAA
jgi:hypothetical protein